MHRHRKISVTMATLGLAAALALSGCTSGTSTAGVTDVAPTAAVEMLDDPGLVVLDVRTPAEYAEGHLAGAVNIDVNSATFDQQVAALPKDSTILVYCRSGNRSGQASDRMAAMGFTDLYNVTGGLADLAQAGAPVQ